MNRLINIGIGLNLQKKTLSALTLKQKHLKGNISIIGELQKEAFLENIVSQLKDIDKFTRITVTGERITVELSGKVLCEGNTDIQETLSQSLDLLIEDIEDGNETKNILILSDLKNVNQDKLNKLIEIDKKNTTRVIILADSIEDIEKVDNFKTKIFLTRLEQASIPLILEKGIPLNLDITALISYIPDIPKDHFILVNDKEIIYGMGPYLNQGE